MLQVLECAVLFYVGVSSRNRTPETLPGLSSVNCKELLFVVLSEDVAEALLNSTLSDSTGH